MFQSTDRVSKDLAAIRVCEYTTVTNIYEELLACSELRQVQLGSETVAAKGKYNAGLKFNERLW